MAISSRDPDLIARTTRLVQFLRELESARRKRIRDVHKHEGVEWLGTLPDEVTVTEDAEPGATVFAIMAPPAVPLPVVPDSLEGWVRRSELKDADMDAPVLGDGASDDVVAAYEEWLPKWQAWAREERLVSRRRRWHRTLWDWAERLSQQNDELEVVLAVGLLSWKSPGGQKVRNHLLVTPVELAREPRTQRVEVVLGARGHLQDRDLLDDLEGFDLVRTQIVREEVHSGERAFGPGQAASEILRDWSIRAFDYGADYYDTWDHTDEGGTAEVRHAPALVLRRRDRATLIAYYDQMLTALEGEDAAAPLGLAQLVSSLEPAERLGFMREQGVGDGLGAEPLFPLHTNPQQREIMERLRHDNGVVVQGPPGTGKTHTIANLLASLLADGKRVLVTSQKAQALRVLRDKLPADVRKLAVSITDQTRGGSQELEGSVNELASRFHNHEPRQLDAQIDRLRGELGANRALIASLRERIRRLREAETVDHGAVSPGYAGTLAAIVRKVRAEAADFGWMPKGAPAKPPVTAAEAGELLDLLASASSSRDSRAGQTVPDPAGLPDADHVRTLIRAEADAHEIAGQAENELSQKLAACGDALFAELETGRVAIADVLYDLDAIDEEWAVRAFQDGLAGRDAAVWDQLLQHVDKVARLAAAADAVGLADVSLPEFDPTGPGSLTAQHAAAGALIDYLAAGGKLKGRLMRSAQQKAAEKVLIGTAVSGVAPETLDLLKIVYAELTGRVILAELSRGWEMAEVTFPGRRTLTQESSRYSVAHEQLATSRRAATLITATARTLRGAGLQIPLRSRADWESYSSSLTAVRLRLDAVRATDALTTLTTRLQAIIAQGCAPPELVRAVAALSARDAEAYGAALTGLDVARTEVHELARTHKLRDPIRAAHPGLIRVMQGAPADPVWADRLGKWDAAWAWSRAAAYFEELRTPGLEAKLEAELEAETRKQLRLISELAAAQAWQASLSRMTSHNAQALRAYREQVTRLGKGTGKYAARYRRGAREAMRASIGAVPAWIMPLQQVVETIPARRDSFDVVIVDEASQAGIDALFLLWLAPRVIVVGDDKQCAPSMISHGELEPIFQKLDMYLPDMEPYLRNTLTPGSSLFDILSTRFGSVIRLKEHFRCMPEIIGYSSRQFYADEPLVPLRQYGADRLDPLRVVRVEGGYTEGTDSRLRNPREAEAIVDTIKQCLTDPAYQGRTFGVVVLQGHGQVDLIRKRLMEEIGLQEFSDRKLRVGSAPDFQGDERDVIFLSMVVAERRPAATDTRMQRIYNVAASRAKDQMWLFHSVAPDLLKVDDLRRSLLTYMSNPLPVFGPDLLTGVTRDEPHDAFDSLFEQRVYLEIRERGYHVVPQWEVNGRRIDLVVSGARGRLAVECDGDHWHGSPDQISRDEDRERELKRAGWRFWRIRESEFYAAGEAALADLWHTLDKLEIRPGETVSAVAPNETWAPVPLEVGTSVVHTESSSPVPDEAPEKPTDLIELVRFYESDGRTRTVAELTELILADLGVEETRKSVELVHSAITRSRRDRRRPLQDREPTALTAGTDEVRTWARKNKYEMDDGRLEPHIVFAYNRAHPERPY
ncbi:AAA family ATPase [Herbidospora sp. NEAU-GS84]|uniref:AAA family ATPase n=1 Tax=Herbidospora solisilvae TaxID=2696284 RepID=A0A7C9J4A4_9ACTN|nr:AAA domain-containing protein [Herbidospora solisilvae]NAS24286.1 AAA family ATPase [Herbidospora solisilvae]